MGWEFGLFAIQVLALFAFGRLRAKLHPGSGIYRGPIPRFIGFIEPLLCRALLLLSSVSDAIAGSRLVSQKSLAGDAEFRRRNANWIDAFILFTVVLVLASYAGIAMDPKAPGKWWLAVIPGWRLLDVLAANLRINLFDHLITRSEPSAASTTRMLILVFINFIEIALSFSCIYAASGLLIAPASKSLDWLDPLYFSWITQLTIGYGDIMPSGWIRFVAISQGIIGFTVLVLIVGRFASSLPRIRSLHTHSESMED